MDVVFRMILVKEGTDKKKKKKVCCFYGTMSGRSERATIARDVEGISKRNGLCKKNTRIDGGNKRIMTRRSGYIVIKKAII